MIDLTIEISEDTFVFPGDPKPEIKQIATINEQGWNEKRITFNSHFATHIDAPFHMIEEGKKLTDYSMDKFVGECVVVDIDNISGVDNINEGDIVLVCTNGKLLTKKFASKLIEKKIKIIGIDSASPDKEPFEIHKMLLKEDILIVENLVGLKDLVGQRFKCFIMPLKIKDADGAPCRVVVF